MILKVSDGLDDLATVLLGKSIRTAEAPSNKAGVVLAVRPRDYGDSQ